MVRAGKLHRQRVRAWRKIQRCHWHQVNRYRFAMIHGDVQMIETILGPADRCAVEQDLYRHRRINACSGAG